MVAMSEKIRKTLYLPDWIAEYLDKEGEKLEGPGCVAAAAIYQFFSMNTEAKKQALSRYKGAEIERAYAETDENAAAQSAQEAQKHKRGQKHSKAG